MNRRRFLQSTTALAIPALAPSQAPAAAGKVPLGMDQFSVRATGWKAPQSIEHAAALKLDTLFLSELHPLESFEDTYLRQIKEQADKAGLALYVGTSSVCPTSGRFKDTFGS